ncbi:MAG: class I SAM-dependent methyltransferase [Acidimicrobiia bacterium]|nr:class I SAM-dependent methyltransferase [Acidimicrobiia bacterium]
MTSAEAVPTGNTYDKYASANPVERRLMATFLTQLRRALPDVAPARVLEVGVGEGEVALRVRERYPGAFLTGVDLPDPTLADHWAQRDLPASFADVGALPFPDRSFGLVLAIEVLEHVPSPEDALAEIARVASGQVVLSVPREPLWRMANLARGKYVATFGNTPGHIQHWTRRSFTRLVSRHLQVTGVQTPPPWTMVSARVHQ